MHEPLILCWQEAVLGPVMESILLAERALLYTLGFDLRIVNPINTVVAAFKELGISLEGQVDAATRNYWQITTNMVNDRYPIS